MNFPSLPIWEFIIFCCIVAAVIFGSIGYFIGAY